MNISSMTMSAVGVATAASEVVLNPAVRAVTDAKKAERAFSPGLSEAKEPLDSSARKSTVPTTNNNAEAARTVLE